MAEKTAAEKAKAAAARKAARDAVEAEESAKAKAAAVARAEADAAEAEAAKKSPTEMTQGELQLFRAAEQAARDAAKEK
jgi:hypothetical protein